MPGYLEKRQDLVEESADGEPIEPDERLTGRLRLRPIESADADELWRLHQDVGVARWYGGTWSMAHVHDQAAAMGRAWQVDGVHKWLAFRRTDAMMVGRGGCSWTTIDGGRHMEIGWAIREDHWGNGYATEIGHAGLVFAFDTLEVDRVVAFTEVHNLRSRAVMDRLGMTYAHDLRRPGLIAGSPGIHHDAVFALYELPRSRFR